MKTTKLIRVNIEATYAPSTTKRRKGCVMVFARALESAIGLMAASTVAIGAMVCGMAKALTLTRRGTSIQGRGRMTRCTVSVR